MLTYTPDGGSDQFHVPTALPSGEGAPQSPCSRRLGELQSLSGGSGGEKFFFSQETKSDFSVLLSVV